MSTPSSFHMPAEDSFDEADQLVAEYLSKNSAITSDPNLVWVCSRVHPLIRDSSSVKRVPFHVEWGRDISHNGTKRKLRFSVVGLSILVAAAFLIFDFTQGGDKFDYFIPEILQLLALMWMVSSPAKFLFSRFVQARRRRSSPDIGCKEAYQGAHSWVPKRMHKNDHATMALEQTLLDRASTMCTSVVVVSPVDQAQLSRARRSLQSAVPYYMNSPTANNTFRDHFVCPNLHKNHRRGEGTAANRESAEHWCTCKSPIKISAPISSRLPDTGEIDEIMSLKKVVRRDRVPGVTALYDQYSRSGDLRVAYHRIRKLDHELAAWIRSWHNCWSKDDTNAETLWQEDELNGDKQSLKHLLSPCDKTSMEVATWGPRLKDLQTKICVQNRHGEGVLLMPMDLLSTVLPRYGHQTTVEEVAYLSAKGADVKHRYYRSRFYVFWTLGVLITRLSTWASQEFTKIQTVQLVTVGVLIVGLWFSIGRVAFDLDAEAAVTGRMRQDCIMKSAGGSPVTAAILALWNDNVKKECTSWVSSPNGGSAGNFTLDFCTFQRMGGLMVATGNADSGLVIYPGANNLRVRRMRFKHNLSKADDDPLKENSVWKASHIVSRSPFNVCMQNISSQSLQVLVQS